MEKVKNRKTSIGITKILNIYNIYLTPAETINFSNFYGVILREKIFRKKSNLKKIYEKINFLDEANMTKFVLNYLKVYEPGKYFFRRNFGRKARQKKAELRFLIHDDMDINYRQKIPDSHFIFR